MPSLRGPNGRVERKPRTNCTDGYVSTSIVQEMSCVPHASTEKRLTGEGGRAGVLCQMTEQPNMKVLTCKPGLPVEEPVRAFPFGMAEILNHEYDLLWGTSL